MKYSKEIKIGVFVVVVLTVSFFLINYLRGEDLFNKEVEVSSRYDDVKGLVASAPVYIKGYKAGKVTEVAYDKELKCFNVVCSVSKDFEIPSDSKMVIYAVDIM
jgi:phospholipid/cholesterol/gamma-HCH transport system substrate-binding protein